MDVDQFLHPETPPEDGPSPFPLPEFEGRALPHLPTGNPNGILPQSPGLRRRGATPGKGQKYQQPQRGCADGSNGWHVWCVWRGYWKYIPGGLLFGTREPHPIPPFDIEPPGGHDRHNPLRGREPDVARTRGSGPGHQAPCPQPSGQATWPQHRSYPIETRSITRLTCPQTL